MLGQLAKARSAPLGRIVTALGIRMTGRSMSRRLATHFGTLSALRTATVADLEHVAGVGPDRAAMTRAELDDLDSVLDRLDTILTTPASSAPAAHVAAAPATAGPGGDIPAAGATAGGLR